MVQKRRVPGVLRQVRALSAALIAICLPGTLWAEGLRIVDEPIRYLLGHMEWPRFENAPFFRELDPSYRHDKPDPGRRFMRRLRARLRGLHLESAYGAAGSTRHREPREARPLTKPVIESQVDGGPWNKARAIYPLKGQRILLRVQPPEAASIRWFQIVPDIRTIYKNANHPWEHNAYKWIGYAKIQYIERELEQAAGKWTLDPLALLSRPPFESAFYRRGVGSYWLQARVARGGRVVSSPGVSQTTAKGLSPQVFRISVREGPGYLGYVTSFFNVPGLFGSTPYQSSNYIGADCADVLMAAHGQFTGRRIRKNYNVAMLVRRFPNAARFQVSGGNPQRPIRWSHDVLPGDLIAVRYDGARKFQHVGVLAEDRNRNGTLDGPDLVLHAGPHPLTYSRLDEGAFDGLVAALRPPTTAGKRR